MLNELTARRVIDRALSMGADFCEIFAEDRSELSVRYENSACSGASRVNIFGAGLYLLQGKSSVYVHTSDVTEAGLMRLLDKGAAFLKPGAPGEAAVFRQKPVRNPNPVMIYPSTVPIADKVKLLAETDRAVKAAISSRYNAEYTLFDLDQRVTVASSDGTWAQDRRVTQRLRNRFSVSNGVESTGGFVDYTKPMGFEAFRNNDQIEHFITEVRHWEESLTAESAPRGHFPVIFEGGECVGTFFHEACGHQLETNNMQAETAYFRDKLGRRVASEKVTLIDDGTCAGMYGSSCYDDEGMPRQKNVLIEDGILKSFLVDRLGSRQFGVPRTGSGRRENYTYAPASRMSNTYLAPGTDDPEEMIAELDYGILVCGIGGGTGGEEFTLACPRCFLIRDGKIDRLLKNAMLIGRGDETMMKIDRVSKEIVWDEGGAFCGAASGLCNTTTFGARMRVTDMVIG